MFMNGTTRSKKTNYEALFFGMIVAAWAVLAIAFNVLQRELPGPKAHVSAPTAVGTEVAPAARG
jgi:hypothetical protein